MNIDGFLSSLGSVAQSPLAFAAYIVLVLVWGAVLFNASKLKTIRASLVNLPAQDRLKALELEYKLVPKGGLSPEQYLAHTRSRYYLIGFLALLVVVVVIVSMATFKAVELQATKKSNEIISLALKISQLGRQHINANELATAAGNLEAAINVHPSFEGYFNLAQIYAKISNTDKALAAYRKAREIQPDNLEVINAIGTVLKDMGKYEEALASFATVREKAKKGSKSWYKATGNAGSIHFEIARTIDDETQRKAKARLALESIADALDYCGADDDPMNLAHLLSNMGNANNLIEQYDKAENYIKKALTIKEKALADKSYAETLNNLANTYLKSGRFAEAEPYLIQALKIFLLTDNIKGAGFIYYNLGDINWYFNKREKAEDYYKQAEQKFQLADIEGGPMDHTRKRLIRLRENNPPAFVLDSPHHN